MTTTITIDELKRQWLADPCWDIETTEGFEAQHDELLAYRLEAEQEAHDQYVAHLLTRAEELGINGHINLVEYIEGLERRLEGFDRRIARLEDK